MKENVFDVLMYLFENYMDDGPEFKPDQEALTFELAEAGFPHREISKAFSWLEGLSNMREQEKTLVKPKMTGAFRHYSPRETGKISLNCRGFLMYMEQVGVLNPQTRELIIDRVMALEVEEITLDHLKWVILMVLSNQPGQEQAYVLLEDLVFDEMQGHLQ